MICGKLVKTIETTNRPCLCDAGHAGGCNPFSANPYMLAVAPPKRSALLTPIIQAQYVAKANISVIDWTLREGEPQCIWQGTRGRCTLRAGHFPDAAHREGTDLLIK